MKAYDCEYTIEQYKILKKIYRSKKITADKCRKIFGEEKFQRSFKVLRDAKLILDVHNEDGVYYETTINGTNTYFILHEIRVCFWKKLLLSKWLDVAVSFITALVTYFFIPFLRDCLSL